MAEPYSVQILVQVLNKVLMPGTQISDEHIIHLVKYITGMPGKRRLFTKLIKISINII